MLRETLEGSEEPAWEQGRHLISSLEWNVVSRHN